MKSLLFLLTLTSYTMYTHASDTPDQDALEQKKLQDQQYILEAFGTDLAAQDHNNTVPATVWDTLSHYTEKLQHELNNLKFKAAEDRLNNAINHRTALIAQISKLLASSQLHTSPTHQEAFAEKSTSPLPTTESSTDSKTLKEPFFFRQFPLVCFSLLMCISLGYLTS